MAELEDSPLIICGAPRSGTTYLMKILNQHPEIFISHETRLFAWLHQAVGVLPQQDQFVVTLREEFTDHLRRNLPDVIRGFYRALAPSVRYWGDKNPHYADPNNLGCLETIESLFPGSRFIHIIRDGRDVVSSLIRKQDEAGRPWVDLNAAHFAWTRHLDIGCAFGASLGDEQYFEVRYEDLIKDDMGVAHDLVAFLGVEMHPDIQSFCEAQARERTPYSGPTRDLEAGAQVSEWSNVLSIDEQLRSLELLGEHLVRHGYESWGSLATSKAALASQLQNRDGFLRRVVEGVPPGGIVLVASGGDDALLRLDDREAWHYPQAHDGSPGGHLPASAHEAISSLEQLKGRGGRYLAFPPAFRWWLEHYRRLAEYLDRRYRVVVRDEECLLYELN